MGITGTPQVIFYENSHVHVMHHYDSRGTVLVYPEVVKAAYDVRRCMQFMIPHVCILDEDARMSDPIQSVQEMSAKASLINGIESRTESRFSKKGKTDFWRCQVFVKWPIAFTTAACGMDKRDSEKAACLSACKLYQVLKRHFICLLLTSTLIFVTVLLI